MLESAEPPVQDIRSIYPTWRWNTLLWQL